jgi:Transposase, Mutator family
LARRPGRYNPVLTVVPGDGSGHAGGKDGSSSLIDEIVREGARRMLAEALQSEVDACIAAHAAERGENGHRLVVRNGSYQPREVLTSAGAVEVTAPRVNDKRTDPATGERKQFSSAILPPWARKTPKITDVLPLLYLHGLSGTRQSRSCGLKQLQRPLRIAGVVAVGSGDVDVAVQAQQADGQVAQ